VNPNIIKVPKHIIYAAIGHHAPPAPDAAYLQKTRAIYEESLGYVPDDLQTVDQEHGTSVRSLSVYFVCL